MAANDEEPITFAKVDTNLDSNPKIRQAGCFGRDIFEFVLRVNSRLQGDGAIPLRYVDLPYLTEQLMFEETGQAQRGLARAVTAKLLEIDHDAGVVRIVGWGKEWGRRPKTGRERTREYRDRQQVVTPNVTRDARDGSEERRLEDQTLSPRSDLPRPELPDLPAVVGAERTPPPGIPEPGRRDPRVKLNHDAWQYAALEHARLQGEGLSPNAIAWPVMPGGFAQTELVKRTREVLALHDPPDLDEARALLKRRVDVAAAESKREQNLDWFTPSQLWDEKKFWRAVETSPADAARPRAGPRGSSPSPPTEPPRRLRNLS